MVCERKVFTVYVPGIPARARVTLRAKAMMATAVLDEDRSVAAVAGAYRCGWYTVHDNDYRRRSSPPRGVPPRGSQTRPFDRCHFRLRRWESLP
ncbi:hypothetical protein BHQ15_17905 [Mycolicibacillus koreensis]|nr:hypothetical protein BHQ15_17905 [Mycolicibacillus koreensis]